MDASINRRDAADLIRKLQSNKRSRLQVAGLNFKFFNASLTTYHQ